MAKVTFSELPDEILSVIAQCLDDFNLGKYLRVCKLTSRVAADDSFWKERCIRCGAVSLADNVETKSWREAYLAYVGKPKWDVPLAGHLGSGNIVLDGDTFWGKAIWTNHRLVPPIAKGTRRVVHFYIGPGVTQAVLGLATELPAPANAIGFIGDTLGWMTSGSSSYCGLHARDIRVYKLDIADSVNEPRDDHLLSLQSHQYTATGPGFPADCIASLDFDARTGELRCYVNGDLVERCVVRGGLHLSDNPLYFVACSSTPSDTVTVVSALDERVRKAFGQRPGLS
jgi:hypothetical protein